MDEMTGLPERRRMPEGLRDRLWAEIEPRLDALASDARSRRTMRAPLAVAASVIVLAAGLAIALPQLRGHDQGDRVTAGSASDARLVEQCIEVSHSSLRPGDWRAGARIDLPSGRDFLVIRNDTYAAVCGIDGGRILGLAEVPGKGTTAPTYEQLSAARPFDLIDRSPWPLQSPDTGTVYFGIATSDVIAVSIIGPDNSVTPAVLRDGTFAATNRYGGVNGTTLNRVRVTFKDGQVTERSFR